MNASGSATRKSKGPLGTGQDIAVSVLWPSAVLDEIDQWAAAQPDDPSRSEAILRLVQQALASTADKQPSNRFVDALARALLPEGNTESIEVEAGQKPREGRWKPRLVETTHLPTPSTAITSPWALPGVSLPPGRIPISPVEPNQEMLHAAMSAPAAATPEAQPATKPAEGNKPCAMPENIRAFDEYWRRAEHVLGRHLEYEEVVVSYNRCRGACDVDRYPHLIASFD